MPFEIKDLLITVAPKEAEAIFRRCLWHSRICLKPTICLCTGHPTRFCHNTCYRFTCGRCSFISPYVQDCLAGTKPVLCAGTHLVDWENPLVIEGLDDLRVLRADLEQTQAQLAELEETGLELDEADATDLGLIEDNLKEALADIQSRRKSAD